MTATPSKTSALVLAARRPGFNDPLCELGNVTHKCMLHVHGQIMLERVVAALLDSGCCRHVYVCIDEQSLLRDGERLRQWMDHGLLSGLPAADNLADSVHAAGERIPDEHWPLLITTGDNALHTPALIRDFITRGLAGDCDIALGVTRERDVSPAIPDSGLNWHWLRDGGVSSCNLYLLRNRAMLKTVDIYRGGGQFGKKHWRILKAFGLLPFLLYKFKLTTSDRLMQRIGRNLGLSMEVVYLPYAYGPIDVDNPDSFALTEHLLAERDTGAG